MAEKQPLTDEDLRQAILRWIDLTEQLEQVAHQLERIKEQYAEFQYPVEIESLAELEPIDRRKRELALDEHDLRGVKLHLWPVDQLSREQYNPQTSAVHRNCAGDES